MEDDYHYDRRISEGALKSLYIGDSDEDIEDEILMNDISWESDMFIGKTPPNMSPLDERDFGFNVCI